MRPSLDGFDGFLGQPKHVPIRIGEASEHRLVDRFDEHGHSRLDPDPVALPFPAEIAGQPRGEPVAVVMDPVLA